MGNQTNLHFLNTEKLAALRAGDVFDETDPSRTNFPVGGKEETPLLRFVSEGLEAARRGETVEELFAVEQGELLGLLQGPAPEDAVSWATTFESSMALDEDVDDYLRPRVGEALADRIGTPSLEEGDFPAEYGPGHPLRTFDVAGWQFFTRAEFDEFLGALRRTLSDAEADDSIELLCDDEWREALEAWDESRGSYDAVLMWWLV